jgi:hypothetical protein
MGDTLLFVAKGRVPAAAPGHLHREAAGLGSRALAAMRRALSEVQRSISRS